MASFVPLAISLGSQVAGKVGMSFLSNLFNKQKDVTNYAKQLANSKKLSKYQNKLDMNSALKLMKKENAYNTQFMSNSSKATQALNEKLMDYQYNLERQSRQTSYQDTRKDLEGAGYNPLLAVGQQSGYTSVGSGVSTQSEGLETSQLANSATDIANKFNEMRNANEMVGQGQQRIDIDRLAGTYQNDLNSAKAEHERSMTRGQDIDNGIQNLFGYDQALATLDLTRGQREMIEFAKNKTLAEIENLAHQNEFYSAQSFKAMQEGSFVGYNAQTNRANAMTGIYNAETERKKFKLSAKNSKYQRKLMKSETDYNKRRSSGRNFGANSNTSVHGPFGIGFSSGSGFNHGY